MIAFKGLTAGMVAAMGSGHRVLEAGVTYREESSKTGRSGWHCTENPFDCLTYFRLGCGNRYFRVEASGSIDEDEANRISCTEITLLEELTVQKLAGYGMMYMVQHPARQNWEQSGAFISVKKETAEAAGEGHIAIARGTHPKVRGEEGAVLGIILEPQPGQVEAAKLFTADRQQAGKWWTVNEKRELIEVKDEEKTGRADRA